MVDTIVRAINSYAQRMRQINRPERKYTEKWIPVNLTHIWRYLGCILYMGQHSESKFAVYWSPLHNLGRFLSCMRFEQIQCYLTLRDGDSCPKKDGESFAWKLEPVASIIRQKCRQNWEPSSHICIDEAMAPFHGRTLHKTKLKNKPISEGYKIWVLSDNRYISDWL